MLFHREIALKTKATPPPPPVSISDPSTIAAAPHLTHSIMSKY
jgi:hypothetical protein